jgi:hypothetical protein
MHMVVVTKLTKGQQLVPAILVVTGEVPKVPIQLIVHALSLAVSLWVIGHQCCQFDPKSLIYLMHEFSNELRPLILKNYLG